MEKKKSASKITQKVSPLAKKGTVQINKPVGKKPLNPTVHSQRATPKTKSR